MVNLFNLRQLILVTGLLTSFFESLFGQDQARKHNLEISCTLPKIIRDNNDLNLEIVITNSSSRPKRVYKDLIEGNFNDLLGDNRANFNLVIQRKTSNDYLPYFNKASRDPGPEIDTVDDHEVITLFSKDSLVVYFHVDELYRFEPGYYRLKCLYWNDIHVNKTIQASWVYFNVINLIFVKHYMIVSMLNFSEGYKSDRAAN